MTYSKTGIGWWHKYIQGIADRIEFQKGRISFFDENDVELDENDVEKLVNSSWIDFENKKYFLLLF